MWMRIVNPMDNNKPQLDDAYEAAMTLRSCIQDAYCDENAGAVTIADLVVMFAEVDDIASRISNLMNELRTG
jgi:hypothetical protein